MSQHLAFEQLRRDINNALRCRTVDEADKQFIRSLQRLRNTLEIERSPCWRISQFVREASTLYKNERTQVFPKAPPVRL